MRNTLSCIAKSYSDPVFFSFFFTVAQMMFCFTDIVEGQCMGQFIGAVSTPQECCFLTSRGGLGATRGGFVVSGTENCISCMDTVVGKHSNLSTSECGAFKIWQVFMNFAHAEYSTTFIQNQYG